VKFKRTYSLFELVLFGLGSGIGGGVFSLTGVAANYAGNALALSYLFSGLVALLTALVYAELVSRMPYTGSGYVYLYATFGELPAWLVGWNMNLRYGISSGALSRALSAYLMASFAFIGFPLPVWFHDMDVGGKNCSLLSMACVLVCVFVGTRGSKESSIFNQVSTLVKVLVVLFIIGFASALFKAENLQPLAPYGLKGIVEGSTIVFYAYLGFDFLTTITEEAKEPKRDVPRAIVITIVSSILIYIAVAISLSGAGNLIGHDETTIADVFQQNGYPWMVLLIYIAASFGVTAGLFTDIMAQSRLLLAYAKDGLFFSIFATMDPIHNVPVYGSWIVGVLVCLIAFFLNLEQLSKIISCGNLLSYSVVSMSAISLRLRAEGCRWSPADKYIGLFYVSALCLCFSIWQCPHWISISFTAAISISSFGALCFQKQESKDDGFKCPWFPFLPCLAILSTLMLACDYDLTTYTFLGVFEAIGVSFYVFYGRHNSTLQCVYDKRD